MKLVLAFCIIFLTRQLPGADSQGCAAPDLSPCTCINTTVNCSFTGMTSVPGGIPSTTTELRLDDNNIATLKSDDFSNLPNLRNLTLRRNNIDTLETGVFADLTNLIDLHLQENNIDKLEPGIFSNLINLERLHLDRNEISMFRCNIFSGLRSLKRLDLDYNRINKIPSDLLSDLDSLERIDLDRNIIKELPLGLFSGLLNLKTIELDNNELVTIPSALFDDLPSLKTLNFEEVDQECCDLLDLIAFGKQLETFDLTCNYLKESVFYTQFDASNCHGYACAKANGVCLPKKMRCRTQVLNKKCGSYYYRCCEKKESYIDYRRKNKKFQYRI